MKNISVVIGSYNRKYFLRKTIETVRSELRNNEISGEIFVVDGGSSDGTLNWLLKQKDIITIVQHNRGKWEGKEIERKSWGYFMNLAFKAATSKYIVMLSDDCLLVPDSIVNALKMANELEKNGRKIGAIAFYWRNWPIDKSYYVGLTLGKKMFVNHGVYLKEALEKVNYIETEKINFYHADGDLVLKMWAAGYECVDCKGSFVEHYADANIRVRNSNLKKQKDDWNAYKEKWKELSIEYEGGWLKLDYADKYKVERKFWLKYLLDTPVRLFWKIVMRMKRKWRGV